MATICRSSFTLRALIILQYTLLAYLIRCDARGISRQFQGPKHHRIGLSKRIVVVKDGELPDPSNADPYGIGSPFTLPPFDSLPPSSLPDSDNAPPFCINPPSPPQSPSVTVPSPSGNTPTPAISSPVPPYYYIPPILPIQSPPPGPTSPVITPSPTIPGSTPSPTIPGSTPSPTIPGSTPSPTIPGSTPSPPMVSSSPPPYLVPSPTTPGTAIPAPPSYTFPGPPSGGLAPPRFLPPVIFPAPTAPPPPRTGTGMSLWCVAKPSVPDPIIQEAMNYACGSGADCASIQPSGLCFQPNTLFAHASYAFNSYWQRTKVAGGTCSFGGTAMLVTVDPSYDGCHFVYA